MKTGQQRIRYLWDQSLKAVEGACAERIWNGSGYTKEEIDAAFPDFYHVITSKNIVTQGAITIRTRDISGHGTAVAAIAAGNGRGSGGVYAGVAPQSEFIVVKLGNPMSGDSQGRRSLCRELIMLYAKHRSCECRWQLI